MFEGSMKFLADHGIDIQNCCGQSYDNASPMSERYNGLQAKVAAKIIMQFGYPVLDIH